MAGRFSHRLDRGRTLQTNIMIPLNYIGNCKDDEIGAGDPTTIMRKPNAADIRPFAVRPSDTNPARVESELANPGMFRGVTADDSWGGAFI